MYAIKPYRILVVESFPSKVICIIKDLFELMLQFANEPV